MRRASDEESGGEEDIIILGKWSWQGMWEGGEDASIVLMEKEKKNGEVKKGAGGNV